MDSIFDEFAETPSLYENVEDQLLSKAMRIPKLQYLTSRVLSQSSCAFDVSEASELILAVGEVDRELANWARQIPVEWSYTTVTRMR
jgi:hypothetical protein